MKRLHAIVFAGTVLLGSSCKKYLDINNNPNQSTSSSAEAVLPQAITGTANTVNGFNSYGSQVVGYSANAGGYGGFGTSFTYNYSSNDWSGLWASAYRNMEDYQYILDNTASRPEYRYFNAAARIMKVYNYQLLVDAYNDIPYTNALQGLNNLTPAYSAAAAVYVSLAVQLDSAIATLNAAIQAESSNFKPNHLGTSDVLFGGDGTKWIQLANTIKLRLIVRATGKATFSNTSFDPAGFLSTDALVNPGFTRDNNKQNPAWNTWAFSYTGGDGNKAWMPTTFVKAFYDGNKLIDSARGRACYFQYPSTATNQLGIESSSIPSCPSGSFWYSGTNRTGTSAGSSVGILKGPNAGYPLILAAESYFLQAEAAVRGIPTVGSATAKTLFNNGIQASYRYLFQLPDGTLAAGEDPANHLATYQTDNSGSYLVNFDLATTTAQQTEAIITQKYIALNYIHGHEAWNEYRRTHYPAVVNGSSDPRKSFACTQSQSTRPDKLPTRILYPTSEGTYNSQNVPRNINPYSSLIFWAQ